MMRSMYAGVSGLGAHQTKMDVIGNNISNVNTTGYKGSRATFKTMMSQMMSASKAPQEGRGGVNPKQVGLGVSVGSIDNNMEQGNLQSTGKGTDLAIEGNGFFVANDGQQDYYTRAGSLSLDESGNLTNSSNGYIMQGWEADSEGNIDTDASEPGNIRVPIGDSMSGKATEEVSFGGNLDARADAGDTQVATIDTFDSLGEKHTLSLEFSRNDDGSGNPINTWSWETQGDNWDGGGTIDFNDDGTFDSASIADPITLETPGGGAEEDQEIDVDLSKMTQSAANYTVDGLDADGFEMGSLEDFNINSAGVVEGTYSNGRTQDLAQLSVASFSNPSGLKKTGDSLYTPTKNSGDARKGTPGSGARGEISAGSLEMSNVDLSEQFTEMITTQRGFQANSKTITTTDQMLQELVNLKR
ncbi:MAG: flagellar hook protein FlgE [Bacillota bacterium]